MACFFACVAGDVRKVNIAVRVPGLILGRLLFFFRAAVCVMPGFVAVVACLQVVYFSRRWSLVGVVPLLRLAFLRIGILFVF